MVRFHRPVLLREVLAALRLMPGHWYLDCTLGDGGHALEILKQGGRVVGVDVDPQALERAKRRLGSLGYLGNVVLIQGNFRDLKNLISKQVDTERLKFAGAIFDLGVSSLQLESPERGFSFSKMGPLDMRMDPALGVRALDLVNVLSRKELYVLFNTLGEEKYSQRLAAAVELARQVKPFTTTTQLAEVVEATIGSRKKRIHPATRLFQALRIAVNDELDALKEGLEQVKDLIEYGHICVISFHSLEDRIVKEAFRNWEKQGMGAETEKLVVPSEEEISENPRSRSAKLRVFERQ